MGWRWRTVALGLIVLLLISFVSPISYLPNPLGLYYLFAGSYRYDPHSPFVNRFATLGTPDPTPMLAAQLDRLLGQTGLDPLDPQRSLVGYRVREIVTGRAVWADAEYAEATVEFRYAGGAARSYRVPVVQYGARYDGSGTTGWRYSGLDRLFPEHLALPYLPPAAADAALQLGMPQPAAGALDLNTRVMGPLFSPLAVSIWSSLWADSRVRVRWAPDGQRFSIHVRDPANGGALRVVPLDGSPAREVAEYAQDAAWDANGHLVFLRCPDFCAYGGRSDLVVADFATGRERTLGRVPGRALAVVGEAAYLLDDEALWRAPLDGGEVVRLAALSTVSDWAALAVAPDAGRIAHSCDGDLCLADPTGANAVRVGLGYPPPRRAVPGATPSVPVTARTSTLASLNLAWNPDGTRLAITSGVWLGGDRGPELWIVDRAGRALQRLPIGPDGVTGEPTWTPDGRTIILTTFPRGGRRIVAIDTETGRVLDLSQPRWDAFAALAPDGERLLLWNGRGGFWIAPLLRRAGAE